MTDQKSGFAPINGTQIYYTLAGNSHAETMVMIHAGICDHRMWERQIAHFSDRFRVLAFDMRGFGQSKIVKGQAFSLVDDIVALLDHFDMQQVWLMACSMGGKMALNTTIHHAERVKGLLLVAPAISGYRYEGEAHSLFARIDEAEEAGDIARICELEVQMWVDGTGRKPEDVNPEVRQLIYDMNFIALQTQDELWEQEIETRTPTLEDLNGIDKPTLVIVGDLDVPPSLERADIVAQRIKGAKKVTMAGTAHIPNMEYPDKFNQIVDDFLGL